MLLDQVFSRVRLMPISEIWQRPGARTHRCEEVQMSSFFGENAEGGTTRISAGTFNTIEEDGPKTPPWEKTESTPSPVATSLQPAADPLLSTPVQVLNQHSLQSISHANTTSQAPQRPKNRQSSLNQPTSCANRCNAPALPTSPGPPRDRHQASSGHLQVHQRSTVWTSIWPTKRSSVWATIGPPSAHQRSSSGPPSGPPLVHRAVPSGLLRTALRPAIRTSSVVHLLAHQAHQRSQNFEVKS